MYLNIKWFYIWFIKLKVMYLPVIFEIKCNSIYILVSAYNWYNFHLDI